MSMRRDIEFLFEMGTLRFIPRQWRRFLNPGSANLAEHHFRVMWTALVIAKHEKADANKVLKMALVHDIMESRTGDADYIARQYVERNEKLGLEEILGKTILDDGEFMKLWQEYEAQKSIEAHVVKDADNLDIDFELDELDAQGSNLKKTWKKSRGWVSQNRLKTKTAKKMLSEMNKVGPHDWHLNGRNRLNAGDWQGHTKPKRKTKKK